MIFYLATRADKCDKWRDKTPRNLKNIMSEPKNIMPGIMVAGSISWPHENDRPVIDNLATSESCRQVGFGVFPGIFSRLFVYFELVSHLHTRRIEQVASKLPLRLKLHDTNLIQETRKNPQEPARIRKHTTQTNPKN